MLRKRFILTILILVCLMLCACTGRGTAEAAVTPEITLPPQTPAPTPEPTPEPTPVPTPRPLQEIALITSSIDESFFTLPGETGTIETVEYQTFNYTGTGEAVTKTMSVYLPYGYSEDSRYDVLFLMHTMCGNDTFWFSEHPYAFSDDRVESLYIPYLIDHLIERGMCRPLVVVSLSGYITEEARYERYSDRDFDQFVPEFRNDILPFVTEHYSVYGTRDHVGFMGASFGAYLEYRSILGPNYDLVSYFALTGGGMIEPGWLFERWSSIGAQDLLPNLIYIAEGDRDDRGPVELGYMYLAANMDRFNENNLKFTLFENTPHDFREWDNTLYNCLQLFFRPTEDAQ